MSELRLEAARRAITWLKSAGIDFVVRFPDGSTEGNLAIAEPEAKKCLRPKVHNFERDLQYVAPVKALKPGDDLSWELNADLIAAFDSSLRATARRYIGKDKFLTERVTLENGKGKVSILRLE